MSQLNLTYTSPTDLIELVPKAILEQVTRDELNGNDRPYIVFERLKASENTVDSFLGVRYKLPAKASDGTTPPEIKDAVLVIAKYKIYARRNAVNASVQAEYDATMNWLKMIASGKIDLALPREDGNYSESGAGIDFGSSYGSLF
jgi:phage gp36-like protein